MKTTRFLTTLALLIALGFVTQAIADAPEPGADTKQPADDTYQLEQVEVKADKPIVESTTITRYGQEYSTVTKTQISDMNAQDLPSALRRVPGVNLARYNIVGSYGGAQGGAVFIRGMGATRPGSDVMTLWDGVPRWVSVWTHPVLDILSIDPISEINVYKGPQSVFLGPATFGAVDMTPERRTEEGAVNHVQMMYGSFDTWATVIQRGEKAGNLDYFVSVSGRGTEGHRENADSTLFDAFFRIGYALSPNWDITYCFDHTHNAVGDPGPHDPSIFSSNYGLPEPPSQGLFRTLDVMQVLTLSHQYETFEGYIKFYGQNGKIRWNTLASDAPSANLPQQSNTDWTNWGIRIRETFHPWDGADIVVGNDLDYYGGSFEEKRWGVTLIPNVTDQDRLMFHNEAPYLAFSQFLGNENGWYAIPSAGVRFNNHSMYGSDVTPQAGLVFGYKATEMHFSFSEAVNYPGVYAAFMTRRWAGGGNPLAFNFAFDSWEDLEPEKIKHYEVGLSHRFNHWLEAGAVYFWDHGSNRLIASFPPPPPPTFINLDRFKTEGLELTATVTPVDNLALFFGATWLHAETNAPIPMPYAPELTFVAGLNWRFLERFQLSADVQYVSDMKQVNPRFPGTVASPATVDSVDGYWVGNLKLTAELTAKDGKTQIRPFIAIDNIGSTKYEYYADYPAPRVTFYGGCDILF